MKWKFIHNGTSWWLRIETAEQLSEYIRLTDGKRFGESMLNIANRAKRDKLDDTHNVSPMASAIQTLWQCSGEPLDLVTGRVMVACHNTYWKLLRECGFIHINPVGGCNAFATDIKAVEYRDNLIFPHYTEKDIRIRTWEWEEKKNGVKRPSGYKYHWYAYLGDLQLKDGDIEKWDTREEALAFAKTFLEQEWG